MIEANAPAVAVGLKGLVGVLLFVGLYETLALPFRLQRARRLASLHREALDQSVRIARAALNTPS